MVAKGSQLRIMSLEMARMDKTQNLDLLCLLVGVMGKGVLRVLVQAAVVGLAAAVAVSCPAR